jgi:hypothetical protein
MANFFRGKQIEQPQQTIPFGSNTQTQTFDTLFVYDEINKRLGINNNTPQATLDIGGINNGVLLPRLTTAQRNLLPNIESLLIYNTDTQAFQHNSTTGWVTIYDSSGGSVFVDKNGDLMNNLATLIFQEVDLLTNINYHTIVTGNSINIINNISSVYTKLHSNKIEFNNGTIFSTNLSALTNNTSNNTILLPNKSGTIALLSDLLSSSSYTQTINIVSNIPYLITHNLNSLNIIITYIYNTEIIELGTSAVTLNTVTITSFTSLNNLLVILK